MEQEVRLIDANKLKNHYAWWENGTAEMTLAEAKRNFDTIVDLQPTVDAVEVVRCKDCIHNYVSTWNHGVRDKPMCHFTNLVRSNEFYCGFGERRGDAETD